MNKFIGTTILGDDLHMCYNWSEGGGSKLVYSEEDKVWKLYEVPIYGGEPQHIKNSISLVALLELADTFT